MKTITIKQPWATLIAEGLKEYEFRTWNTKYRGDLLIHAGKSIDKSAMNMIKDYNLDYPTGCIIAKCKLADSICVDDKFRKEILNNNLIYKNITCNDWNGYGFKIENVKKIKPIYINGKLSLWNYDYKE